MSMVWICSNVSISQAEIGNVVAERQTHTKREGEHSRQSYHNLWTLHHADTFC